MQNRIFLSKPDITELEEQYVLDAIKSGWVAPVGPDLESFEMEVAKKTNVRHAVALSSGTAGLHLGLLTLGVGPGDVVITSTMTFAATANAIAYVGATPYFIDSYPKTGNMDVELLRSGLEDLSREGVAVAAVVPVDLLGKTVDYTAIEAICLEFDVPLLPDAAESFGASHQGKMAGSFGVASVISFNGNKIMTTSGGGMLLTDDESFAERVRYLATQARQPVVHYEHTDIGYNYRLSNVLAALGRAQLSRLEEMIEVRRKWRNLYRSFFEEHTGIEILGGDDLDDNCWLTSIILDPKEAKLTSLQVLEALKRENIESRPLWKPMHLQPIYKNSVGKINGTSQDLFETGLTLPSGSGMTESEFDKVLDVLQKALTD